MCEENSVQIFCIDLPLLKKKAIDSFIGKQVNKTGQQSTSMER